MLLTRTIITSVRPPPITFSLFIVSHLLSDQQHDALLFHIRQTFDILIRKSEFRPEDELDLFRCVLDKSKVQSGKTVFIVIL